MAEADLVISADGIDSSVRSRLFPAHPGAVYAGYTIWRLIVTAPPAVTGLETWGPRGQRFAIVPGMLVANLLLNYLEPLDHPSLCARHEILLVEPHHRPRPPVQQSHRKCLPPHATTVSQQPGLSQARRHFHPSHAAPERR
jgi:hypothetical protein